MKVKRLRDMLSGVHDDCDIVIQVPIALSKDTQVISMEAASVGTSGSDKFIINTEELKINYVFK